MDVWALTPVSLNTRLGMGTGRAETERTELSPNANNSARGISDGRRAMSLWHHSAASVALSVYSLEGVIVHSSIPDSPSPLCSLCVLYRTPMHPPRFTPSPTALRLDHVWPTPDHARGHVQSCVHSNCRLLSGCTAPQPPVRRAGRAESEIRSRGSSPAVYGHSPN